MGVSPYPRVQLGDASASGTFRKERNLQLTTKIEMWLQRAVEISKEGSGCRAILFVFMVLSVTDCILDIGSYKVFNVSLPKLSPPPPPPVVSYSSSLVSLEDKGKVFQYSLSLFHSRKNGSFRVSLRTPACPLSFLILG